MLKEQIFEAVEALRIRKCRPDRETIAHFCTRKFGVQFQEVFTELENIVDQGGLLKVEYKGSTSYRSPGQFDSNSSPLLTKHSKILNSSRTSRLVITAVSELLNENQAWNNDGIPQKDLETKLTTFDAERFNAGQMQTILEREIAAGNLVVSKKTRRIFPKDLFPKDDDLPEETGAGGSGRRSGGGSARGGRRGKTDADTEPGTSANRSKAGEDEEERKDVVEKLAAAVRKTYGFAKSATSNNPNAADANSATGAASSTSPASGNASDSSARTPSPNTRTGAAGGRQSVRNKRKKEVFDPSDPPPPKQQRQQHGSASAGSSACKVCSKQVEKDKTATITCVVCTGQYHSACVPDPHALPQTPMTPAASGRTRSTRRSTAAAAATATATPSPPKATSTAATAPWTCPACKECDICGGGGNTAIGEEDLTDYACSNPKCDSVVTLHEGCIVGAVAEVRKCVKCGVGVVGPPGDSAKKTGGGARSRSRGGATAATAAASKKKTTANAKETSRSPAENSEPAPPAPADEIKEQEEKHTQDQEEHADEVKQKSESEPVAKADEVKIDGLTAAAEPPPVLAPEAETAAVTAGAEQVNSNSEAQNHQADAKLTLESEPAAENGVNTNAEAEIEMDQDHNTSAGTGAASMSSGEDDSQGDVVEVFTMAAEDEHEHHTDNGDVPRPDPAKASSWSPKEVEAYFHSKGLIEEGTVFREQEIDGVALLIMRREDIVHGMKFLLGPALKIYRLIVELQKLG